MKLLERARSRLKALNACMGITATESPGMENPQEMRAQGCAVGFGTVVQNADAHLFAASSLFQEASVDFLHDLSGLMTSKTSEAGKAIVREEASFEPFTDCVYWVCKGLAEMRYKGQHLGVLGEGEVFGDFGAFRGGKQLVTVECKTRCTLRCVRGCKLKELVEKYKDEDASFLAKWEAHRAERVEQLKLKDRRIEVSSMKPVHLDFMFLKLADIAGRVGGRTRLKPAAPSVYKLSESLDLVGVEPQPPCRKAHAGGKLTDENLLPLPGMISD
jgi:hypothetical protein